jgi:hypothetical protein
MKTRIKYGALYFGILAACMATIYFIGYTHALDFIR